MELPKISTIIMNNSKNVFIYITLDCPNVVICNPSSNADHVPLAFGLTIVAGLGTSIAWCHTTIASSIPSSTQFCHAVVTSFIENLCMPSTKPQSTNFKLAVIFLMKLIDKAHIQMDKFCAILLQCFKDPHH